MTTLPFVISTEAQRSGEICGFAHLQTSDTDHNDPPLCHLDRSAAKWRDLRFAITRPQPRTITTLPFVISTEAQRSGEICGFAHHQTSDTDHNDPPLCHLDRSAAGFPTSRCRQRLRVRLSVKRAACRPSKPRAFTGNPGERSGEICGLPSPDLSHGR